MFYVSALNADPWIVGLWWFIMEFVFTCIYGASVVLPVLLLMAAEQRLPLCEFSEASSTLGRPVMSCCDQVHNYYRQNVLCLVLCLSPVFKTCVLCLRPASSLVSKSWTPSSTVGSTSAGGRRLQKGVVGVVRCLRPLLLQDLPTLACCPASSAMNPFGIIAPPRPGRPRASEAASNKTRIFNRSDPFICDAFGQSRSGGRKITH